MNLYDFEERLDYLDMQRDEFGRSLEWDVLTAFIIGVALAFAVLWWV